MRRVAAAAAAAAARRPPPPPPRRATARGAARRRHGRGGRGPAPPPRVDARGGGRAGWERIHLSGLHFTARHGVLAAERALGQRFVVDVVMDARLAAVTVAGGGGGGGGGGGDAAGGAPSPPAPASGAPTEAPPPPFRGAYADDVRATLDYATVYAAVAAIVTGGPAAALVESLAAAVADEVLAGQPLAAAVWVRVTKPHVALGGVVGGVGVEVYRTRLGGGGRAGGLTVARRTTGPTGRRTTRLDLNTHKLCELTVANSYQVVSLYQGGGLV
ncbi:hypothetical protein BU14_0215s0002 [Porphyra umbilicalis]|uniref:dihydroneopterin aldolase n=1 Tax=Porphyra umbilicalis TaxID=2786 RepID=A0A1X6P4X4_PORUM|nr:hypothetical protein BU14_0215s0002 [Porphyra umbilicalis]|eukprot:OSX75939.1 hypothetical protein BU14_0215s0002 [Porphyra umbilicalis]